MSKTVAERLLDGEHYGCSTWLEVARLFGVSDRSLRDARAKLADRGTLVALRPEPTARGFAEVVERIAQERRAPDFDLSEFGDEEPTNPNIATPPTGTGSDCLTPGRYCETCDCNYCKRRRRELERRASDFEPIKPEDFAGEFDTSIGNVAETGAQRAERGRAAAEKRQEFNRQMGEFATDLRDATVQAANGNGSIGANLPPRHAAYISQLAEQERRFGNRRWARSIAIAEAHEQLSREAMIHVADTYFRNKIEPTGYARFAPPDAPMKRTACVLLSDLHLGSELDALDEPHPFGAWEEARRLEFVLRQFLDFKPQYRETTEALVIINGDIIEGMLQHDLRSGSPLAEQKAIFWHHFVRFIALVAQCYKKVRIVCQPGNHGRDKLRHPGRATSSKWDGHEWSMYYALKQMCVGLVNVEWSIPFRAVSIENLHGQILGITHADTELKLGHPDTKHKENMAVLIKRNSTRFYGVEFDGWAFGHYHTGRMHPGQPSVLWNGALVPPNGHARTSDYGIDELCGQWIFESVEGHLFGDARFIKVGKTQDNDERLGELIPPFRFSMFKEAI